MNLKHILLSLLLSIPLYGQSPQVLTMWDKPIGGLNTTKLPMNLDQYQFAEMNNVYSDDDNGLKQCQGLYAIWSDTQTNIRFMKEYTKTDGNRYLVYVSSNRLNCAYTGGAYTTLLSTISLTGTIWGVQYNNKLYIGDSDGDSWSFDGTSLLISSPSSVPSGKYAVTAYGILFVANQTNLNSKVSYSMIDDFNEFNPSYYFLISKDDGEDITGMFQFRGDVYITKRHSLHKLLNISDNTNIGDDWITQSCEVGCVDGRTIQELNNSMYWLSENGIVMFDGTGFTMLSTDIKPTIQNISEIKSGIAYDVLTTSADFATGIYDSPVISTITGNAITLSTIAAVAMSTGTETWAANAYDSTNFSQVSLYQTFTPTVTSYLQKIWVQLGSNSVQPDIDVNLVIRAGDLTNGTTLYKRVSTDKIYEFDFSTQTITLKKDITYQISISTASELHTPRLFWGGVSTNTYTRGVAYRAGVALEYDLIFKVEMSTPTYYYYSPLRNANSGVSVWKQWQSFVADSPTDDTKYYIKTATDSAIIDKYPWTAITNNSVISSTMGAYYKWYMVINSTNTGFYLNDASMSFFASNPANTLSSGIDIANQRYMLGYTELPSTIPNKVLVWQDRNKSFTMLSGFNPTTMGYYKNDFYIGTIKGNINRFSYDYTDINGTSLNPYFKTGDFDFGARIMDKYYKELWLSYEPTTVYTNSTIDIYINRSTWVVTTFDFNINPDPHAPSNSVDGKVYKNVGRFKNISFKISNFTQFNGLNLIYNMEPRR